MLRYYRRALQENDRKSLADELSFLAGRRKRFRRFVAISSVLILAIGSPLAVLQGRNDQNLFVLAVLTVAVYIGIIVWVYRENVGDTERREASIKGALDRNEARVLHCQAAEFLEVPELEDEGAGYFFQVGDDLILYLGGQEYYPTPRFPCSDFELIELLDHEGIPAVFRIDCHGPKAKPGRILTPATKLEMIDKDVWPEDLTLIEGAIADVEERLLGGSAVFKQLVETD